MQTQPFFGASWCNNPTLIPRFMKSFFNIKPLPYKPNLTWDVSKILKFISTLMPLESLNLKMLTTTPKHQFLPAQVILFGGSFSP
jgi:hypothetical protein